MATYAYKAKTIDGKVIKGRLDSSNKKEAVSELSQMNLIVYEVEPLNDILNKDIVIGRQLKQKDFVIFLRQFATLMEAGILLVDSVELLAEQSESKALQEALEEISVDLKEGITLSEAMKNYPKLFPELLIQMIKSGEVSGQLEEVLERMATYYEKQHRIKQKVSTALTYPIVVGTFAVIITVFLLLFIVPIFGDLFASFGSELPLITQIVLSLSQFIQQFWWLFAVIMLSLGLAFLQLKKIEDVAYYIDMLSLKIPVIGTFIQKAVLARMTQTLSSLINSSVPILQAVEVTSQVVGNRVVKEVLLDSRSSLERGESLAKPMAEHWVFPPLIIQMIRVGEQSGALDDMLKKVADIYDQEVNEASDKLQSLIEPVLIIFLAFIVGIIVLSIVVPMFSLFEAI
ncbi:type IV pilus assembly protein PilC [Alkalibacterium putridalgicola]|uniref:Secretion system protein n=1 Tax=Alkalibacterium putridalgicola TaxID=426703 RepID=A0A1H7T8C2_9LACT|nr:type II secretion system F family protein [Alkalibacterium putridalgicola]GEK89324.1 secretion system protein [Alkalibacterium putridalgicola]SEL80755.1 type IV pilus assembly protein PilC [Alkalibacterium putridalgicola]